LSDRASSAFPLPGAGALGFSLLREPSSDAAVAERCLPEAGRLSEPPFSSACHCDVVEKKDRGVTVGYEALTSKRQRPKADRTTDRFIEAAVDLNGCRQPNTKA
jgi:hypothetical protein